MLQIPLKVKICLREVDLSWNNSIEKFENKHILMITFRESRRDNYAKQFWKSIETYIVTFIRNYWIKIYVHT